MAKRVGEKEVFKTDVFTIKEVDVLFDNGKKVKWSVLEKKPTALLVPITSDGKLLLIREYYTAIDRYELSLPKGRIDKGNALETANKELQEEVGFKAKKLDKLGTLTMSPGYLNQTTHVFLATDLVESKLDGDEAEELEVIKHPFDKFEELIDKGELNEARMIAAVYMARRFLEKKKK